MGEPPVTRVRRPGKESEFAGVRALVYVMPCPANSARS